jgi:hypothetical protein
MVQSRWNLAVGLGLTSEHALESIRVDFKVIQERHFVTEIDNPLG